MNKTTEAKTKFPISIKATADLIKRDIELRDDLAPVDLFVQFLISINKIDQAEQFIRHLQGSDAYNQAACTFISTLIESLDDELIEIAKNRALQMQEHITDSELCRCHPYAELAIIIACKTEAEEDITHARSMILQNGSLRTQAQGLLKIFCLTENDVHEEEDERLIQGVLKEKSYDGLEDALQLLRIKGSERNFLLYCEMLDEKLAKNPEPMIRKICLETFCDIIKPYRSVLRKALHKTRNLEMRAILSAHIPQNPTLLTSN